LTRDQKTLRETFQHVNMLVNELRTRPDVQLYFRETGRRMPSGAPGEFLRALMPDMLSDSQILMLASECTSAMGFLAARSILYAEADKIVVHHNPVEDRYRTVRVIREKVYA
jgi:hypothetical protein